MTRAGLDKDPAEVAAMFDEVAPRYDLTNTVLSLGQDRGWRRAVAAALDLRPGERVLDLAAGTATSSAALARGGADVVGCDFSLGMLQVGRRAGHEGVELVAGDALRLPFTRRRLRRGDDLLRAAQHRRPRPRPARAAPGHPARRAARGLRVQPPGVARRSGPSTTSTSCGRCRRSPAG